MNFTVFFKNYTYGKIAQEAFILDWKNGNKDLTLDDIRKKINETDDQLLNLINQRAQLVAKVGKVKSKTNTAIYIPEREKQIFEKLKNNNNSDLPNEAIVSIFTEIISACRNLEKPLTVSYLGPEASFTHSAAIKQFGSSVKFLSQNSIESVFFNVTKGFSDYGVVPIENTTEGTVNYTLDKFTDSKLNIVAEIELKITHSFLSIEDNLKNIKKIYSHPQSFAQCKNWILNHLPNVELIEVNSNSYAAKLAAKEKYSASIGPEIAALKYNLNSLFTSIEDFEHNTTRFFIIGKNINKPSGHDKTSIMFSPREKIGALYEALKYFNDKNINLTMIESRPNKKNSWQYIFFLDMEGYFKDDNIKKALEEVKAISTDFKILGSYPMNK
ncbi:MAG: chorismate mutase [Fusobacteriia bacterium 4572_132]|nr:MAG: chorismate mutase [Fusobacteriia bacterium 4572_132]